MIKEVEGGGIGGGNGGGIGGGSRGGVPFGWLEVSKKKKANKNWRTSGVTSIQPTRFEISSDRTCPERKKRNAILYVFTVNGDTHGKQIEMCFSSPTYLSMAHLRNP
ncbi:hypothetical protein HZH68_000788 [Vespula germanica]|uniref:Uncharacterized protein n=1 Tax=Vespula germanica TaxID=30212 RepID=A0A834NU77_VESGE|nr:hypothetical protein HZH68_000788 [Vespula germanica]